MPPLTGTPANESVLGTTGDDLILNGGGGSDLVRGNGGNDILIIDASYTGEVLWEDMTPGDVVRFINFDCELDVSY